MELLDEAKAAYEKHCRDEYEYHWRTRRVRHVLNEWETLPPEERAEWVHSVMRWGGYDEERRP